MAQTRLAIAHAVIEAGLLARHIEETDAFHRDMERSLKAIQESRELLKRLRQSHRDDVARGWLDDPSGGA